MIKDYWVYQPIPANGEILIYPWALYIVKEYDPRKKKIADIVFDVTVYSEDIPNDAHSHSAVGISGATVNDIIPQIVSLMDDADLNVTSIDEDYIKSQLLMICAS